MTSMLLFRDVLPDKRVTLQALQSTLGYRRWLKDALVLQRVAHPEQSCAAAVEWYQTPNRYAPCSRRPKIGRALCDVHTRKSAQAYLTTTLLSIVDQLEPLVRPSRRNHSAPPSPRTRLIWTRREKGEPFKTIAADLGVSATRVHQIYYKECHRRRKYPVAAVGLGTVNVVTADGRFPTLAELATAVGWQ